MDRLIRRTPSRSSLPGSIAIAIAMASCGVGDQAEDLAQESSAATAGPTCSGSAVRVLDLRGDLREIWKGLETADAGKQADPNLTVGIDFNATVRPSQVAGHFLPDSSDGKCGTAVAATVTGSVIAPQVWGAAGSNATRPTVPGRYNVFVRDGVTGIVSSGGAVAAGGDVRLSSMSVNGAARQAAGLIAGGRVFLSSGSIAGNLSYGAASTIPQTVTVTGSKSQQPFDVASAFQDLVALSALLAEVPSTGTATLGNGSLQMTGTSPGSNVFQVSSDTLAQATSVQVTVPAGAAAVVNVTGAGPVSITNKGVSLAGATASTVLWNLPSSSFVQISGVSLVGSMLAPRALVSFESGAFNGTLVCAALSSSGSGSLQYTPLNVAKVFDASAPSQVRLGPAQPLVRGCKYRLSVPSGVPITASNACLSTPLDVPFVVAKSPAPPGGRELVSVELDPVSRTLRRFTARPGVNTPVDDVWSRYESSIGIATTNLVATSAVAPSSTRTGQTVRVYQQYAQGYPVAGYGYFVATEGNLFRAANGKVMPGLPVFPPPSVTAATALQNALTFLKISPAPWVAKPALYQAPIGRLTVVPKKLAAKATDFALAWGFRFGPGTGIGRAAGIQIDAATGAVLAVDDGRVGLTTLNASATYVNQTSATVDSPADGAGKSFSAASYRNSDGTTVATLAGGDITANGAFATVTGVTEDPATGWTVGTPQYVLDPTPATPWTSTEVVEQRMASLQWGLEMSTTFMRALGLRVGGMPWQAIDGPTAKQKVFVNYTDGPPPLPAPLAHYAPANTTADVAHIFIYRSGNIVPVEGTTTAHEYAHALVHDLRRAAGFAGPFGLGTLANYNEAGAINEGVADMFAIAVNHKYLSPAALPWYCIQFDFGNGNGPECLRNTQDPLQSTNDPLRINSPGSPILYKDTNLYYGDYSASPSGNCIDANDMCGVHLNSTIVSHWGYLLGAGSAALASVPCSLTIDPLDPDLDTSLRLTLRIALLALGTRTGPLSTGVGPQVTFAEFRDATLQVAEEMVAEGTLTADALPKIEAAWAAVGLPASTSHSTKASPGGAADASGSAGVYPWVTFTWPSAGDGQAAYSWDFQLANGSFDTDVRYHQEEIIDDINDFSTPNTTELRLSLPENSPDTFSWRVRPHSSLPWQTCYPIHSFIGTTEPDVPADIRITKDFDETGELVKPGQFWAAWTAVRGTVAPNYDVYVSTVDGQCADGDGVERPPESNGHLDEKDGVTWSEFSGIIVQPKTHYFMNIRPVGPPDFAGVQSRGKCVSLEFDTAQLPPPIAIADASVTQGFVEPWQATFNWTVTGGAAKSLINLYERDENGDCAKKPSMPPFEVTSECLSDCFKVFFPKIEPANPTGYCWDIVDVAKNGEMSPPSETKQVLFEAFLQDESPGVIWSNSYRGEERSVIPGDSYGADVTFSWTTGDRFRTPGGYGFRIGRWRWPDELSEPVPATCVDVYPPFSTCMHGPTDVTITPQNELTVAGDDAGKGRYCWGAWPILDDPSMPGMAWARQPLVAYAPICYTTGPAPPRIIIPKGEGYSNDPKVPPPPFKAAKVSGQIELDFLPDSQMKGRILVNGVEQKQFDGTFCASQPDSVGHQDVYDCKLPFTVNTEKNTTYEYVVDTYNITHAGPILDDDPVIHHVVGTITTGTCGATNTECCEDKSCANPQKDTCYTGKCVACGKTGGPCCKPSQGPACTTSGDQCNAGGLCANPCATPLTAPTLPQPPLALQGVAGCDGIADLDARVSCITAGGPASDFCQYFASSFTCGIGWPAVAGADHYRMSVLGGDGVTNVNVPGVSGQVTSFMPIGKIPLAGTVQTCGIRGFGVLVTPVDACGNEGQSALTGIGCSP